ncbi:hypothetical protein [Halarchaeum acidiphilum]|uniref:hypothetical protein n=1 Tax=Halarchaeum acidiphilum TaxID=489138 RepID=UPI00035E7993|nr:hypothetical protein [Halarchaeum acidiphilum]
MDGRDAPLVRALRGRAERRARRLRSVVVREGGGGIDEPRRTVRPSRSITSVSTPTLNSIS